MYTFDTLNKSKKFQYITKMTTNTCVCGGSNNDQFLIILHKMYILLHIQKLYNYVYISFNIFYSKLFIISLFSCKIFYNKCKNNL